MNGVRQASVFGKRKEPHTVIIARGDQIRHFTVRPWVAALCGSMLAAIAIGYLAATSYLVLRDDLIGASMARQARMQQAYEDRISQLRAQVDRITSRQLLDQQLMENKVTELIERQSELTERQGRLGPVLERLRGTSEDGLPDDAPVPEARPELRARHADTASGALEKFAGLESLQLLPSPATASFWPGQAQAASVQSSADKADKIFVAINRSLRRIESEQISRVDALTDSVHQTATQIGDALAAAGLAVEDEDEAGESALGGPLLPVSEDQFFEERVRGLDEALDRLEWVKSQAKALPIHNPAPGRSVSSTFGVRRDPIIGRPAMHSGMDFRATSGTTVLSTGEGIVKAAGWNGGYGKMVEIDHGNGLSTRYAHMSKIIVGVGDEISVGEAVGLVGSTGRSTGPHLHYEVRRDGKAVDPLKFLKAGRKIADLL